MRLHSLFSLFALASIATLAACGGGGSDKADSTQTDVAASATKAAAQGVSKVLDQEVKGRPIPREGVPDFVETMPIGSFITGSKFSNDLRSGGTLYYSTPEDRAAVVTFYKASIEKNGFKLVSETEAEKRGKMETALQAKADDGRTLNVFATQDDKGAVVQANFTVPAAK